MLPCLRLAPTLGNANALESDDTTELELGRGGARKVSALRRHLRAKRITQPKTLIGGGAMRGSVSAGGRCAATRRRSRSGLERGTQDSTWNRRFGDRMGTTFDVGPDRSIDAPSTRRYGAARWDRLSTTVGVAVDHLAVALDAVS